jgi:hypothetical protein
MTTAQSLPYAALESQLAQIEFWRSEVGLEYAGFVKGQVESSRVWTRPASDMRQAIGNTLQLATPFFVSSEIIQVLHNSMGDFPKDLPFDSFWPEVNMGWAHMETPFMIPFDKEPDELECKALLWVPQPGEDKRLSVVFFGGSIGGAYSAALRFWAVQILQPDATIANSLEDESMAESRFGLFGVRFLAVFFSFLRQKLVSLQGQRAPRPARKRFWRITQTEAPLVRVIQLRRREVRGKENGHGEPRDWSHRWIVSGHWRKQWYSSRHRHEPLFIDSYVKGPDDKPLKARRVNLYAVVN